MASKKVIFDSFVTCLKFFPISSKTTLSYVKIRIQSKKQVLIIFLAQGAWLHFCTELVQFSVRSNLFDFLIVFFVEPLILLPKITLANLASILVEIKSFDIRTCFSVYIIFWLEKTNRFGKIKFLNLRTFFRKFMTFHKITFSFSILIVQLE